MGLNRETLGGAAALYPDVATGSLFFIGNATVLIRYAGFTILTDPNFLHRGEKVRLGYGLRSTRLTEPAMDIRQLPTLDAVVLSHLHEDHFDRVAERDLDHAVPILTTRQAAATLKRKGFLQARGFQTWQSRSLTKGDRVLRVTSLPGKHGPGIVDKMLPSVMGSMLEFETTDGQRLLRMYITGDTLVHGRLKEIPRRFPDIDMALLHLGGTRIFGILLTMDGRQGVEAMRIVSPRLAVPIHYNDYTVFKSPLTDFQEEVRAAGLEHKVRYVTHGDTYEFQIPDDRRR